MDATLVFNLGLVFSGVLLISFIIQLVWFFGPFSKVKPGDFLSSSKKIPVSVVVCARNEKENLERNIPLWFGQQYPEFEIVVVNDCSFDGTEDLLKEFSARYPNLHVVTLKDDVIHEHDKKLALMLGIKGAKHDVLLLTDADCSPRDEHWISRMAAPFSDEKIEVVLGYGGFEKLGGLINRIIRFDAFYVAIQYLGLALSGKPYMGTGRNMAYRKELFFKHRGFATHYHIQSGDDDLFINRASTPENTAVVLDHSSHTVSVPKSSFSDWVNQKRRHISTAKYYKSADRNRLAMLHAGQYLFFLSVPVLLVLQFYPFVVLGILLLRLLIQLIIFNKAMAALDEKDLIWALPFYELILLVVYPFISFSNLFRKKPKWR